MAQSVADATAERRAEAEGRWIAARETLNALEASIQTLHRRQQELAARLRYARLAAPFSGFVSRRLADSGDFATPGRDLVSVEDHSRFRIAFDIPQEEPDLVRVGSAVRLVGRGVELRVDRLYPALNPDRTRTVEVYASADSVPLPGSFVRLEVNLRDYPGILIPESALLPAPDGSWAVFRVEGGRTRPETVRLLGVRQGVAAVAGIPAGTPVVVSTYLGWNRFHEGEIVEVLP
ncbi:MAG: hypothetical protein Kow001_14310 [Acidobacteriota bacterium]